MTVLCLAASAAAAGRKLPDPEDSWRLGRAPLWTDDPERFLKKPWLLGQERMKPFYLAESPSA